MTPLYVLLGAAGLLVVALIDALLRLRPRRLRGAPFRQRPFLAEAQRAQLRAVAAAAGAGYRVFPHVSASALLQPERRIGRRQRRLASQLLCEGAADLLVCAEPGARPVCVVRLDDPGQDRARRRHRARLQAAFAAAGLPVVELPLDEVLPQARLEVLLGEAIAMAATPERPGSEASAIAPRRDDAQDDDAAEDTLLAGLAAAMREPDAAETERSGPQPDGRRG